MAGQGQVVVVLPGGFRRSGIEVILVHVADHEGFEIRDLGLDPVTFPDTVEPWSRVKTFCILTGFPQDRCQAIPAISLSVTIHVGLARGEIFGSINAATA